MGFFGGGSQPSLTVTVTVSVGPETGGRHGRRLHCRRRGRAGHGGRGGGPGTVVVTVAPGADTVSVLPETGGHGRPGHGRRCWARNRDELRRHGPAQGLAGSACARHRDSPDRLCLRDDPGLAGTVRSWWSTRRRGARCRRRPARSPPSKRRHRGRRRAAPTPATSAKTRRRRSPSAATRPDVRQLVYEDRVRAERMPHTWAAASHARGGYSSRWRSWTSMTRTSSRAESTGGRGDSSLPGSSMSSTSSCAVAVRTPTRHMTRSSSWTAASRLHRRTCHPAVRPRPWHATS